MENFESIKSDKEAKNKKIEEWKLKLSELIADEKIKEKQGQKINPHLPEINIEFLRAEDIENFGKFIDQALSKEAHQEYRKIRNGMIRKIIRQWLNWEWLKKIRNN